MQTKSSQGTRFGKSNLNIEDRRQIERYLRGGLSASEIARELNRSPSAIQKEITRGKCEQIVDPIRRTTAYIYDWYYAQKVADNAAAQKGRPRKIEPGNPALKRVIELIKSLKPKNYSPYAALTQAANEKRLPIRICTTTLYTYIHSGEYSVSGMNLLRPNAKRQTQEEPKREAKNRPAELSIDNRPKVVTNRLQFGHWEGDLVCPPLKNAGAAAVFTLVERKTRNYFTYKIPSKSPRHVKKILDLIEGWLGDLFPQVFKTITFDNGCEFVNYDLLTRSLFAESDSPRFGIYYAHPYCSGERGSNENANGFLRRFFPKGTDFSQVSSQEIRDASNWINNYPRALLGGKCAAELFTRELKRCHQTAKKAALAV